MSEHSDDSIQEVGREPLNQHQEKLDAYLTDLLHEKMHIDQKKYPHAYRLIEEEIQKAQASGRAPFKESKFVDVYRERPIKVAVKVLVPTKEHPRYNFIGKILGPKGNTLKQLQEETMCHISICGRGSIRDRQKEEELRQSLEPKYAHLHDELHMDINTLGPPAEAHARIAFALAEIRKYLIPEYSDGGRQEALMEIMSRPRGPPMRESIRESMREERLEGHPVRKHGGILKNRARVAMEDYEEDYEPNGVEYEEYSGGRGGRPSGPGRASYVSSRSGYREDYEPEYYRESSGAYSSSGAEFGYKKRKTFMD